MWQGFSSRGAAGVTSVRRHQELPPHFSPELTASSGQLQNCPLPKAEPIQLMELCDNTFNITGKKKSHRTAAVKEEQEKRYESNSLVGTKVGEEGGTGDAPAAAAHGGIA